MFRAFGHQKSSIIDGGLPRWVDEGLPVETSKASKPSPTSYSEPELNQQAIRSQSYHFDHPLPQLFYIREKVMNRSFPILYLIPLKILLRNECWTLGRGKGVFSVVALAGLSSHSVVLTFTCQGIPGQLLIPVLAFRRATFLTLSLSRLPCFSKSTPIRLMTRSIPHFCHKMHSDRLSKMLLGRIRHNQSSMGKGGLSQLVAAE